MKGNVIIPKSEYLSLRIAAEKLAMLEGGGVDNWDWYSDSLWPQEGENIEQIADQLEKEISEMPEV